MSTQDTGSAVARKMGGIGTVQQVRSNRISIRITPDRLREAVRAAEETLGCDRLIQITSADTGEAIEASYHLTGQDRTVISIVVPLPRDNVVIPTVSDIFPSAGIFERQVHDLMGITFQGHPNLARIILSEDWPEGEYPLRKDWKAGGYEKEKCPPGGGT